MFWSNSDDIDMFKEMVTCLISTLIDDICPTVTVKVFPYQKPWVGWSVLNALNAPLPTMTVSEPQTCQPTKGHPTSSGKQ